MEALQSTRQKILEIAGQRDGSLHTLPTLAHPRDIQRALESLPFVLPEKGVGAQEALQIVLRDVIQGLAPGHAGPRYFGLITGGTLPTAQLADFLTTIYDQNPGANRAEESIAAVIESRSLEFVLDLLRLPREKFPARALTTGATASNVMGLAVGRDFAVRTSLKSPNYSVSEDGFGGVTVTVVTDRPHASLMKAAALVGIGRANVVDLGREIGQTGMIGIDLEELEKHFQDTAPGSGKSTMVCMSFGEVNTGDFTPHIHEIRRLCDKYSVWLHIDAAFGAYARLVPDLVGSLGEGLDLADSITVDAHKWLNVPYDCGIFFSNSVQHQSSVFGPSPNKPPPAYLNRAASAIFETPTPEMEAALRIPDPMNLSIEFSRRFRALPLFTALLDQGYDGYSDIVRRNISFARRIAKWMCSSESKGYYEVLNLRTNIPGSPTIPLNMLLFRSSAGNPVKKYLGEAGIGVLVKAINETRKMYVTPTAGGVRIAVSNWSTGLNTTHEGGKEKDDYDIVVEALLSVVESPPAWVGM